MENNIPDSIKVLADSPEIFDATEKVGKKFGLHIDQIGELDAHIRQVLRGYESSKEFTKNIQQSLEINGDLAKDITSEVNQVIFQTIRAKLQSESTEQEKTVSPLEKAGNFSVEPSLASPSADGREPESTTNNGEVTEEDRADILSGIENPAPTMPTPADHRAEPLVDHLLSNPASQPEQNVEHDDAPAPLNIPASPEVSAPKPAPAPIPKPAPQPRSGPDPYREVIE